MAQSIDIGETTIQYDVRFSDVAKRKSIHVTRRGVEVVAPDFEDLPIVQAFVKTKRRWLFNAVREIEERSEAREAEPRFETGAKVMYRGRRLRLTVLPEDVSEPKVTYRTRFDVTVPRSMSTRERPEVVKTAVEGWMKERCYADALRMAREFSQKIGVERPSVRLSEQTHMWGTCGKDDVIRINWRLVQAPVVALEYVVAHEVCHLMDRSHGDAFWLLLGRVHPNWQTGKEELERWERSG